MLQNSNMTKSHKGMRKGISLVEMLIAVILFGVIATISYSYYKNYYDTTFAAKQLRVYVVMDQATQLSTAYDVYEVKNGAAPTVVQDLVDDRILTAVPVNQPFVSASGWEINSTIDADGSAALDTAFVYPIDSTVASGADKLDYCNILNNTSDTNWSVDQAINTAAIQDSTNVRWLEGNASATSQFEYFHCAEQLAAGTNFEMVFIKTVDPL